MNGAPTFRTLHEAIVSIKETWPAAASWPELRGLEEFVPVDPSDVDSPLPATAVAPVVSLLEKLRAEIGPISPMPLPSPFSRPCELLAQWVAS